MKLKQYERYQIDFTGKFATASCALLGISLFLHILHYFPLEAVFTCSTAEIVFLIGLPVVVSAVYIAMMRCIRWNAPGVYGIIGCIFLLMVMGWSFASGNALRIVLAVIWYLISCLALLAVTGGFLPARFLVTLVIFAAPVVRVLLFDFGRISGVAWLPELSDLCILLAIACIPLSLKSSKQHYAY